eukprot:410092_1
MCPSPHHLAMNMMSPSSPRRHNRSETQEIRVPPQSPRSSKCKKQLTAHHKHVTNVVMEQKQDFYTNQSMEQLMDEFTDAMRSYFDRVAAAAADMIENSMDAQRKQLIQKGIILEKENRKSKRNKVMDKTDQHVVRLECVRNRKSVSN